MKFECQSLFLSIFYALEVGVLMFFLIDLTNFMLICLYVIYCGDEKIFWVIPDFFILPGFYYFFEA